VSVERGIGKDLEGNCNILTEEISGNFSVVAEENVKLSGKEVSLSEFETAEEFKSFNAEPVLWLWVTVGRVVSTK
jgi:hypothetical protein